MPISELPRPPGSTAAVSRAPTPRPARTRAPLISDTTPGRAAGPGSAPGRGVAADRAASSGPGGKVPSRGEAVAAGASAAATATARLTTPATLLILMGALLALGATAPRGLAGWRRSRRDPVDAGQGLGDRAASAADERDAPPNQWRARVRPSPTPASSPYIPHLPWSPPTSSDGFSGQKSAHPKDTHLAGHAAGARGRGTRHQRASARDTYHPDLCPARATPPRTDSRP